MEKQQSPSPSRKAKKKSAGISAAALAVCVVLLTILSGVVIGRYQQQLKSGSSIRAKEFYFTSDFLDDDTHTLAPPTPAPAGAEASTQVSFTLGNHADELRFSEVEISYTVSVTADDGSPNSTSVSYGNPNRKLGNDKVYDDTVTIAGLKPGKTYTVTATGTGGYSKTLTAKVNVPVLDAMIYQYKETFADHTLLTVWNEGESEGTVTISYEGIPDNTNPNMLNWATNGSQSVQIGAHESKVFRFFNATTVTVNGAGGKIPD